MTELDIESLSPDLSELLARERDRAGPPAEVANCVFDRVATVLNLGGGGGDDGGGSGALPPNPSATARSGAANPAGAVSRSAVTTKSAAIAVTAFVLGAGSGAFVAANGFHPAHPAMTRTAAPHVVVVRMPALPAASNLDTIPLVEPAKSGVVRTAGPAASVSSPDAAKRDVDLAREGALLATARTALAKGQGSAALAALDRHVKEFPSGRLAEERESLRVQALLIAGDRGAAEWEAEAFRNRYPKSMLQGAIDQSLKNR